LLAAVVRRLVLALKPERYACLKEEFPTESNAVMAEATIPLREAGLWKRTFLKDIMLTRKGKAWLARYRR
jgi:hypothetical protein